MIELTAIVPKKPPMAAPSKIKEASERRIRAFAGDLVTRMQQYPTQRPTTSGYVRSGNYGRGWRIRATKDGLKVVNEVQASSSRYRTADGRIVRRQHSPRKYAVWVGGSKKTDPGQATEMGRRGWLRVDEQAKDLLRRHRPLLIQSLQQGG